MVQDVLTSDFFLSQIPGVTDLGLKPRKMQKVAVIGGGLMGSGIATALIVSGVHVILKEINADYLKQGINRISGSQFYFILLFFNNENLSGLVHFAFSFNSMPIMRKFYTFS